MFHHRTDVVRKGAAGAVEVGNARSADLEAWRNIGHERDIACARIERARAHELIEAQLGDVACGRDVEPAVTPREQDDGALRIGGLEQYGAQLLPARLDLDHRI